MAHDLKYWNRSRSVGEIVNPPTVTRGDNFKIIRSRSWETGINGVAVKEENNPLIQPETSGENNPLIQPETSGENDLNTYATNIKEQLVKKSKQVGSYPIPSIFEVPSSLRKLHPDAFLPHVVSIGPYHREFEHLKEMEKHKWRLLERVIQRPEFPLDSLVKAMLKIEEGTRNCYHKPIQAEKQEFLEMMLLDACFIIELLYFNLSTSSRNISESDSSCGLFVLRGILPYIQRDLLMLENQLPLTVVEEFFNHSGRNPNTPENETVEILENLALNFFNSVIPEISKNTRNKRRRLHLLDIVHRSLEPSQQPASTTVVQPNAVKEESSHPAVPANSTANQIEKNLEIVMHSVTQLRGTGIKFEKTMGSTKFTDIEFKERKLLIPHLVIHGSTKSIFLNLMAFEQCYPYRKSYVTSYVTFMDGLINSPRDVEHLYEQGIIVHHFGSEEDVSTLFNNLRKETAFDTSDYYLSKVSQDLDVHYRKKWPTWMATLKHEYFKDPWKIISLAAATFLILLTMMQSTYSVVAYHRPP